MNFSLNWHLKYPIKQKHEIKLIVFTNNES